MQACGAEPSRMHGRLPPPPASCAHLPACLLGPPPPTHAAHSHPPSPPSLQELRDLIKRFLVRATSRRIGCMAGGVAEVKQHPWFKGFDWDALAQRKLKAPYVPKVRWRREVYVGCESVEWCGVVCGGLSEGGQNAAVHAAPWLCCLVLFVCLPLPAWMPNAPAALPGTPSAMCRQVSGPADASNFDVAQTGQHAKHNSRYISTGVFKDF